MSRQSYKKSHSSRKEWEDIFQKKSSCTNPRFCASRTKHHWTGIFCSVGFSARSDLQSDRYKYDLLGRICYPTAISMSICNAETEKRKRIINPYTKCCRITNTAEREFQSVTICHAFMNTGSTFTSHNLFCLTLPPHFYIMKECRYT